MHVESLHELERLAWLARGRGVVAPALLRVNLAVEGLQATTLMMGGRPTPFGIAGDQLPTCLAWLRGHPEIRLRGFHFHLMSHQLDAAAHLRLLGAYLRQVRHWRAEYGIDTLDQVNVGGGIGVNYREPRQRFDWAAFAEGLSALSVQRDGLTVRFECGRYITAFCGYYAMEVIDVKSMPLIAPLSWRAAAPTTFARRMRRGTVTRSGCCRSNRGAFRLPAPG
ncbi:hypothetical protein ACTMU2_21620 [Cupriavidus basilensis]